MVVLLHEKPDNLILSQLKVFLDNYPYNARGYLGSGFKAKDLDKYKVKPLFTVGWLLIYQGIPSRNELLNLVKTGDNNLIIIQVSNNVDQVDAIVLLEADKIPFTLIDNSKQDKEKVCQWLASELEITPALAKRIYHRCGGYYKDIHRAVTILREVGTVTVKEVDLYIQPSSKVPMFAILDYFINNETKWTSTDIITLLHEYKYGFKFILNYLKTELSNLLMVSGYLYSGIISLSTVKSYRIQNKGSDLAKLGEAKLIKYIKLLESVSDEYLYFLYNSVSNMGESRNNIYKMILLIKLKG